MNQTTIFLPLHPYVKDLTGQQFGRLTVLGPIARVGKIKRYKWLCRCACGDAAVVCGDALRGGTTHSCGCIAREIIRERNRRAANATHGMCGTPTYSSWQSMLDRCRNPKAKQFKNYGGRGIKVCERWQKFENFYADMGSRPDGETLDRINVNGDYEPGNCRWADDETQYNNTRKTRLITVDGVTLSATQWKRKTGICVHQRLHDGWTEEEAIKGRPPRKVTHDHRRKRLTYCGETRTIQDWAERLNINVKRIHNRLARGWTVEETLRGTRDDEISFSTL